MSLRPESIAIVSEFNNYGFERGHEGMTPAPNPETYRRDEPFPVETPWREKINCGNFPLEKFDLFGLRGKDRIEKEQAALKICGGCVVSTECLEFSLTARRASDTIVFGNKTLEEIKVLSRMKS